MKQNFSCENIKSDFIKGTCLDFSESIKIKGVNITDYRYSIDDFLEDDFILGKVKEAGLTHVFFQVEFYVDEYNGVYIKDGIKYYNHLTLKNHSEQNDPEIIKESEWTDKLLEKYARVIQKIVRKGLIPIIKIMSDHYDNNDSRDINNPDIFFYDYLELTKKILDSDKECDVELITIANESGYLRTYFDLKEYWKKYIYEIKRYRFNRGKEIKVSMSQFSKDIVNGICSITDLVDIIGFNYYPSIPDVAVPSVEQVIERIYNNDIYVIQQYCKSLNKNFIITEYGCSCWEKQSSEPEMGNSMALYYKRQNNYLVQAAYLQGGCIGIPMISGCIGLDIWSLNKGSNYNWVYKCNIDTKKSEENIISYNAVKSVWGDVDDVIYNDDYKLWFSESQKEYLSSEIF